LNGNWRGGFGASAFLFLLSGLTVAVAGPPVAEDDQYVAPAGGNLSVDREVGVLANDMDPDGDPLTAVLVADPPSGAVVNLFDDGSFEYEPPAVFQGIDTVTYQAFDGTSLSNVATVEITVSNTEPIAAYVDEAQFLDALAVLGLEATEESFEDDDVWGTVRSTIAGGFFAAPEIYSAGVRWTSNYDAGGITTGGGPARTGNWGSYAYPHGNYLAGPQCLQPGVCSDGFIVNSRTTLYAASGWITGSSGGRLEVFVDGDRTNPINFNGANSLTPGHQFFGVVVEAGFHTLEYHETEGTQDDAKFVWADDFLFATVTGVHLSVIRETGGTGVTLQWLGGQPTFTVYRSFDAWNVTTPGHELGQTTGRNWIDDPPPGDIYFYRVLEP
jgi:hypothetical protein